MASPQGRAPTRKSRTQTQAHVTHPRRSPPVLVRLTLLLTSAGVLAAELERFTKVEKKIRSLEKQKRSLEQLKERVRSGFELDAQQQMKLRSEAAVNRDLARFRSILGKQLLIADAAGEEDDDDDDDGEIAAGEAAARHEDDDDEDVDEDEGLDDSEEEAEEEKETPTERVRMDRASRDAALVCWRPAPDDHIQGSTAMTVSAPEPSA